MILFISFSIEITINSHHTPEEDDDYPTVEADFNALEAPTQKSFSASFGGSISPRQFGCSSFCYNQGVCVLVGQSITCRCAPGFIGIRCQVPRKSEIYPISLFEYDIFEKNLPFPQDKLVQQESFVTMVVRVWINLPIQIFAYVNQNGLDLSVTIQVGLKIESI